ncbi:MAG TPA: hypothetical protein DEH78_11645 [Solibacterales bacterium]|nr:hypothetical protein [Bryobacterales bacterium]
MPGLNIIEKVIALEAVELFRGLSPDQLARIASIAREITFAPNQLIVEPGRMLDSLYVILDGAVALSHEGEVLHTARQNELLGTWALFDEEPMPVTATTIEDTRLLSIARTDFFDLLSDNMQITASIFSTMVRRFRQLVGG